MMAWHWKFLPKMLGYQNDGFYRCAWRFQCEFSPEKLIWNECSSDTKITMNWQMFLSKMLGCLKSLPGQNHSASHRICPLILIVMIAIQDETVILRPIYQNRSSPQEYFSWRNDVWKYLFQSWRHKDTNATEIDNVRTHQNGPEILMLMTHFCSLIAVHCT